MRRSTAAWDAGLRYFDTAPLYGHGLSEARIGRVLAGASRATTSSSRPRSAACSSPARRARRRAGIYHGTPPLKVRFDYSRDGVLRSFEASLERLGLDRVDILYVHDLEPRTHGSARGLRGALARADRTAAAGGRWTSCARAGVVAAIGLGVNEAAPCERMLGRARSRPLPARRPLHPAGAGAAASACCRPASGAGVGVVIGGPFNSGVLARPRAGRYNYAAAPARDAGAGRAAATRSARASASRCPPPRCSSPPRIRRWSASSPAGRRRRRWRPTSALMDAAIPPALWAALKDEGLIDPAAPTPADGDARHAEGHRPAARPRAAGDPARHGPRRRDRHRRRQLPGRRQRPAADPRRRRHARRGWSGAILSVLPLEQFEPVAAFRMAVDGAPDELPPVIGEFERAAEGGRLRRVRSARSDGSPSTSGPAPPTPSSPPASGATGAT